MSVARAVTFSVIAPSRTAFDDLGEPDGFDDLVCHFITVALTELDDHSTLVGLMRNLDDRTRGTPTKSANPGNVVKDFDSHY